MCESLARSLQNLRKPYCTVCIKSREKCPDHVLKIFLKNQLVIIVQRDFLGQPLLFIYSSEGHRTILRLILFFLCHLFLPQDLAQDLADRRLR
jgi:hypothetical protein